MREVGPGVPPKAGDAFALWDDVAGVGSAERPGGAPFAGQLGYMGMNSEGVSHFANAVPDVPAADDAPPPECGHYPLKRTCFEQRSVEDCGEHNNDACSRLKQCRSVSQRSVS